FDKLPNALSRAIPLDALNLFAKIGENIALRGQSTLDAIFDAGAGVQVDVQRLSCLPDPVDAVLGLQTLAVFESVGVEDHVASGCHIQAMAADTLSRDQETRSFPPHCQRFISLRWAHAAV